MPKARNPNREKAFEIYKKHKGEIDLVEIASQLNLAAGTVRGFFEVIPHHAVVSAFSLIQTKK